MNPAPYPATVRAKGWRFEIDHERIEQSATWALAAPEVRPWLLMLWMTAWKQTPCGSLDADEEVIAARIGMPPKMWAKHRSVLMRGWTKCDDGRLYHQTLTGLVLEMVSKRRSEADRKAQQRSGSPVNVPRDKHGTAAESDTDHRPPEPKEDYGAKAPASSARTPAGSLCLALKAAGIGKVAPGNLRLQTLLEAGATEAEFLAHVPKALEKGGDAFAYLLGIVEGERKRAVATAGALHQGAMPEPAWKAEKRERVAEFMGRPKQMKEVIDVDARALD